MIPGFLLGKAKRIDSGAMTSFGNLLSDVAMPSLVLAKLIETDIFSLDPIAMILCMVIPAVVIFALYFISTALFRPKGEGRDHSAARFCATFSNCGFLGIPLAAALFPEAPEVTVYVSLANVTSTFLLLTLGMSILEEGSGKKCRGFARAIFRPVTFAVMIGFACSALNIGTHVPKLLSYFSTLSQLTTPLSMVTLGFELSKMKVKELTCDVRVYTVAALKLVLSPLIALAILLVLKNVFFVDMSLHLSSAMLIVTAVSTAASASAMAKKSGIDGSLAAAATLVNTLLCVVSLPVLWLLFDAVLV